jgi:hypothetical protein
VRVSVETNTIFKGLVLMFANIKLRKELAKKRESDPNWLIKNGRIVRKKPRLEMQEKYQPVL